mmetsp:Transcript_342/g.392  ORF Transcript_342/g.392 Transcript_342/m.392 type:complete len:436 (+) Transcript_342:26-1333(+)
MSQQQDYWQYDVNEIVSEIEKNNQSHHNVDSRRQLLRNIASLPKTDLSHCKISFGSPTRSMNAQPCKTDMISLAQLCIDQLCKTITLYTAKQAKLDSEKLDNDALDQINRSIQFVPEFYRSKLLQRLMSANLVNDHIVDRLMSSQTTTFGCYKNGALPGGLTSKGITCVADHGQQSLIELHLHRFCATSVQDLVAMRCLLDNCRELVHLNLAGSSWCVESDQCVAASSSQQTSTPNMIGMERIFSASLAPLTNLTEANLGYCSLDLCSIQAFVTCCPNVKFLSLRWNKNLTREAIDAVNTLEQLTHIDLGWIRSIDDVVLSKLAQHNRKLRMINVENCMKITDLGMTALLDLKELEKLSLVNCVHVSDISIQLLSECKNMMYIDARGSASTMQVYESKNHQKYSKITTLSKLFVNQTIYDQNRKKNQQINSISIN